MNCFFANSTPGQRSPNAKVVVSTAVPLPFDKWPVYLQKIAAHRIATDAGVGDTVERVIGRFGGDAFKQWYDEVTGFKSAPCRCAKETWNRSYSYSTIKPA